MNGLRLPRLVRYYRGLRDSIGLDLLCVQENRSTHRGHHSEQIAAALGPRFGHVHHPNGSDVSIVYDRRTLRCVEHSVVPLPRLRKLTWFERRYTTAATPRVPNAQVVVFEPRDGPPFTVANFHLSTAGDHDHRRRQLEAVVEAIRSRGTPSRAVACGDTNAFCWRRRRHPALLEELLAPLRGIGARDHHHDIDWPTHHFSRQHEPKLTHQLAVLLGRLGIDLPLRYDVVCTNLPVAGRGHAYTPDSDHDLVWAALRALA
jgi:endonuclease/exonuclease/phosphatase family metal-dependent hydrolase